MERRYIDIHSVIGDAPARAFIKYVKQYSDYHKCDNAYEKENGKEKLPFPKQAPH